MQGRRAKTRRRLGERGRRVGTLRGTCAHHITVLLPELPPARRVAGCAPALPSACKRRNDPHDRAAPSNGDEPKGFVGKLKTCRMSPHAASRAGIACGRLRLRLHTHGSPCTVSATSRRVPKASQASAPPASGGTSTRGTRAAPDSKTSVDRTPAPEAGPALPLSPLSTSFACPTHVGPVQLR